ncbi:MAG: hypothetical protein JWM25_1730 [Thermoleophilia bacterium]|nr:hypothetical protein [Thermoleophilia bacterium]MCZ4497145.1 hypothetical protein [Thermoleophilia bacterium]
MSASASLRRLCATLFAVAACLVPAAPASANQFHVECPSSHVAYDDPIVFPGQPGASHRHEFFGARTANAASTAAQLEAGTTSCGHRSDTASYWVPTLEVNGRSTRGHLTVYYQRAGKRSAAAPPRRLRLIAGDMRATTRQSMLVTHWQCTGRPTRFAERPACRRGERLAAWLLFPDCWDGRRIDSPDHKSHLAYARAARCPATHPVELMRVAYRVTWPVRPIAAATVTLGGGVLGSTGMHGDFWNTWRQSALYQLRWDCLEVARPCGLVSDRPAAGRRLPAGPRPAQPAAVAVRSGSPTSRSAPAGHTPSRHT